MALSKQAKTLNKNQTSAVLNYLAGRRNALRNQVIFLLSVKGPLYDCDSAGQLTQRAESGPSLQCAPMAAMRRGCVKTQVRGLSRRAHFEHLS